MNKKNEQKRKNPERFDVSFRQNIDKFVENLEKLKPIYNTKTNTALLEKLVEAEIRRQGL